MQSKSYPKQFKNTSMRRQIMKVVVTGGAGFIGSNFVLWALKNEPDWEITNVDKLTYAGNLENLKEAEENPRYSFVQADITDREKMNEILKGVDLIVHFAAESHVDRSILEPAAFVETNVVGTQVLLQAALDNDVKHFHHVSTDEVFGALPLDSSKKFDEFTPYDPHSPYSASKAASDHLVRAYGDTFGLKYTITNCSNNYGPLQFPEKLIPLIIANCLDEKPLPVYGKGENVRDWLYVTDHCVAIDMIIREGRIGEV
jgi:dTDP-glucose 4,6-dehydratase